MDNCWSPHDGGPTPESSGQRSIFCPGCTKWQSSAKKPWLYAKDHKKRTYSGKLYIAPVKAAVKANVAKVVEPLPMDLEHPDHAQPEAGYDPDVWSEQAEPDPIELYTPEEGELEETHIAATAVYSEVGEKRPRETESPPR